MRRSPSSPLTGTHENLIPDTHKRHRQDWWDFVLKEAEPWHREHLTRLFTLWEEWNDAYFGGALVPPYILLSETCIPRALGDCSTVSGFGAKSQIRLRPSLLRGTHPHVGKGPEHEAGRFAFVADVLLHEMIHQWQQEVTGIHEASYHGHGPAFTAKCNEIGQQFGLPRVRCMKKRGKDKDLPSCAQWPHCVREPDFYHGAHSPRVMTSNRTEMYGKDHSLRFWILKNSSTPPEVRV
jgi:hypothetical protein